jgi:beta-glucosidase
MAALLCVTGTTHAATDAPPVPARDDANANSAQALVSRMTIEEKLALIVGDAEPTATYQGQAGYLAGVPRLKIPAMRFADGPPGVLTRVPSSSPPATMALAATFSREDARLNGIVIADEANRLGIDVALQPFVNIDRDITFGRAYNTLGEDPVLTGAIGASLIHGLQSRGVMAQVKHYVGYDTDAGDVKIDMQTLQEVYLAPFDAAVKAGVSSIMCSYNKINGPYACGNRELLVDVLRGEMGFTGYVTSDWGAVHDYDYMAKGLDMEMGGRSPAAPARRTSTGTSTTRSRMASLRLP